MASYERLQKRIDPKLTEEKLTEVVEQNPTIFRKAVLKGGRNGLAKVVP